MTYRLSDLKNFVQTTKHRTIVDASRSLGISQPALSQSIKRLESDMGLALLFRTRQGISLSPQGRNLLIKAQKIEKAPFYRDLIHMMYRPKFGQVPNERTFLNAFYAASSKES